MKISICIPQYNRIEYLLANLHSIAQQTYADIEVVISDDCSTDGTAEKIESYRKTFRYPLVYSRNESNLGYDRNFRKSLELATGDYGFVLGNDDALSDSESIAFLCDFLMNQGKPDLGFCNMLEGSAAGTLVQRAAGNRLLGSGKEAALKYYSCFSFVGGLVYKLDSFRKFNSDRCDGSIYSQMYLGVLMLSGGCSLFCIEKPLVIKDLLLDAGERGSYKDRLAKTWKEYKVVDGGLHSVVHVLITGFREAGVLSQGIIYHIFRRIYLLTYPYWVMDYRSRGAFPEAWGLFRGLAPSRSRDFGLLSVFNRLRIRLLYSFSSLATLCLPVFVLKGMYKKFYHIFKR